MQQATDKWLIDVTLPPPSLGDNTADADRLIAGLKKRLDTSHVTIDRPILLNLPELLRQNNYRIRCVLCKDQTTWNVIFLTGQEDHHAIAGLAVDLGTSRVVVRLINLIDGRAMAESAFDNPQLTVGVDVLTRIHHADTPGGLQHLQELIIDGLNQHMESLCRQAGIAQDQICLSAVAGNTAMTHLFLGLNPHWMIREPYIPAVNRPGWTRASDLGLGIHPCGRVLVFPNIGSYFGGDLIAGILYSELHRQEDTAILVDVGTNAEVVLGNHNWMMACAGAAGPALEGGVTKMGMMAGPGVIDRVDIDPKTRQFRIHTIDDQEPVGICGSGLIDLAAQMFLAGMIDVRGRLVPGQSDGRYKERDGMGYLVVLPADQSGTGLDLTIGQADLDSLTRSKAAMFTILETITTTVGMTMEDLSAFYVAGTFGSFIRPTSAISIGMLPDLAIDRYQPLGNSSLGGATLALTSTAAVDEIDAIQDRITYMELNVNQDFMNRFSAAKFFPHTDPTRFPSVKVWEP